MLGNRPLAGGSTFVALQFFVSEAKIRTYEGCPTGIELRQDDPMP